MTRPHLPFILFGLAAASVALCALPPQSFLDGNPKTRTDPHLYPVQIITIDGAAQRGSPTAIAPGAHWVELQTAPDHPGTASKTQTFVLKIEPCTYYYLGAHKDPDMLEKWKLVVDQEETIKGCDPAQEIKNAKANQAPGAVRPHPAQ